MTDGWPSDCLLGLHRQYIMQFVVFALFKCMRKQRIIACQPFLPSPADLTSTCVVVIKTHFFYYYLSYNCSFIIIRIIISSYIYFSKYVVCLHSGYSYLGIKNPHRRRLNLRPSHSQVRQRLISMSAADICRYMGANYQWLCVLRRVIA